MLPLLVWFTMDIRIKKSLLKYNCTIRKNRYMYKWIFLFINIMNLILVLFFFFFQAEDGIRDIGVTGVQTCDLPISEGQRWTTLAELARDHANALREEHGLV